MFLILRMTGPLRRESDRAGKSDFAIDDENAAVRTAIGPIDPPGMSRMIVGEFAARLLHHAHIGIFQIPSRTDAVEKNTNFNTGLRAFDQRIAKLTPDIIRINNVSFEIDGLLRGANRLRASPENTRLHFAGARFCCRLTRTGSLRASAEPKIPDR